MKASFGEVKDAVLAKAGDAFVGAVRLTMDTGTANAEARRVREKYPALPADEVAEILIRSAARKTKWEGAANGLVISAGEVVVAAPVPEPTHKVAAVAGVVTLVLGDLAYATKVQVQLLLTLAEVYGCPFNKEDEEDVYIVFKAALGLKGTERVGGYARFVFNETARKQFRALLRTGVRRAVQKQVTKVAGQKVGRYLGERYVMKLIPVVNAGIGYFLNNTITKSVGKWGKVKAKLRSSTFRQIKAVESKHPESLIWILPIIFHTGTANDSLTENALSLYSQSAKRLNLTDDQIAKVTELIDAEDLSGIFGRDLPQIPDDDVKRAIYELALTTAAISFAPTPSDYSCVAHVAECLRIPHDPGNLAERVRYLAR